MFIDRIHSTSCRFICSDFRRFDTSTLSESDFVYADPPYLITCATYNENDGWKERDERDLLNFLDFIHARGIKFALSNVLSSKGKKNVVLSAWLEMNAERYNVVHLKLLVIADCPRRAKKIEPPKFSGAREIFS